MRRREFFSVVGGAAAWPLAANAQQTAVPLIGVLSSRTASDSSTLMEAFGKGLNEFGFSDGKTVSIKYSFADGNLDKLPDLATDLVRRGVSVLVAVGGSNSALAARRATSTIPIVFVIGGDPVKLGLAASLARPSGNATGMTINSGGLAPKRLGLLRELAPKAKALAGLTNPNTPEGRAQSSDMLDAALSLGLKIRFLEASDGKTIENAFASLHENKVDALMIGSDPVFDVHRDKLVALVAATRLPAIWQFRDFTLAGGLMSYDPDIQDAYRQAGVYAGRVLKGVSPTDLPIHQPTKFKLVINLKTARLLGLTVPATILAQADEVIE